MKQFLFVLLSFLAISNLQSQISLPEEKGKLTVGMNALVSQDIGFQLEFNLNYHLNKKTELYGSFAIGNSTSLSGRAGILTELAKNKRFSLHAGVGLNASRYHRSYFDSYIQGVFNLEIPIEVRYHLSESASLNLGIRPNVNLNGSRSNSQFSGPAKFADNLSVGLKYRFEKKKKTTAHNMK